MEDKAYLSHINCNVKNRIQREKQVIQSDQDVHVHGLWWMERKLLLYDLSPYIIFFESMANFFFLFFMDPKCGLCAVWGVLVYEHGWFLRLMRSRIMNNMELGVFTNIIDIFKHKNSIFYIFFSTIREIFSLWGPKTAYHEVIRYHLTPILVT